VDDRGTWYKSKKGWVSAVIGAVYLVLDHWGRAEAARDIYKALAPAVKLFPSISPFIPPVLFALALVFFEAERRKRPTQAAHIFSVPLHYAPAMSSTAQSAKPDTRVMVNVTPEHLTSFYREGHTSIQAGRLAEAFIDKWMTVSGPIGDVLGSTDVHRMVVFADRSIHKHNYVNMFFDDKNQFDRLSTLKPGDKITVIGKIAEVNSLEVKLNNCELVES